MICFCKNEMEYVSINKNDYYRCFKCHYLKKINTVSLELEKARYDKHIVDDKYVLYMKNVYNEIKSYLSGDCIDYGCGKKHTLADIICENGLSCDFYDYFYFKDLKPKKYDTIILIEVFEHINDLVELFCKLDGMLKLGGKIIIKTQVIPSDINNWWYLRDITHVSFVDETSMTALCNNFNMKSSFISNGSFFVIERI